MKITPLAERYISHEPLRVATDAVFDHLSEAVGSPLWNGAESAQSAAVDSCLRIWNTAERLKQIGSASPRVGDVIGKFERYKLPPRLRDEQGDQFVLLTQCVAMLPVADYVMVHGISGQVPETLYFGDALFENERRSTMVQGIANFTVEAMQAYLQAEWNYSRA